MPVAGTPCPMIEGKVIVTGGCGGVGAALVEMLRQRHYDVIALDLRPPRDKATPWRYCDLRDRDSVMRLLEGATAVLHLGEIPNTWGPFSPDEVYANNTRVTSTVFQSAAYLDIKTLIYASSAQVYGVWGGPHVAPLQLPLDEDHPLQPNNAYALGKYANEQYLKMLIAQNPHMAGVILRFPGVMDIHWPWEYFVEWLRPTTEYHDGYGTYVHRDDLCEAFILSLEAAVAGEVRTYNVVADDIANLTPTREYLAAHWPDLVLPDDHPEFGSWASADKLKAELGWEPKRLVHRDWQELQSKKQEQG